jgi:hypothetical protein
LPLCFRPDLALPLSLLPAPQKDHALLITFCALTLLLLSPIRSEQHHFVPCQCIVLGPYPCLDISDQLTILLLSHTSSITTCYLFCVYITFSPGRDYLQTSKAWLLSLSCRLPSIKQVQDFDWRRSLLSINNTPEHNPLQQEPWKSQHTHLTASTRFSRTLTRTIANTTILEVKPLTRSRSTLPWQTNIKISDAQVSVRRPNRALLLAPRQHYRMI